MLKLNSCPALIIFLAWFTAMNGSLMAGMPGPPSRQDVVRQPGPLHHDKGVTANPTIVAQSGTPGESSLNRAKHWKRIAEARRLVIQSIRQSDDDPSKAIRLAIAAANSTCETGGPMTSEARQQLYQLIADIDEPPNTNSILTKSRPGHQLFFSDNDSLVTRNGSSPTYLWHLPSKKVHQLKGVAIDSRRWLPTRPELDRTKPISASRIVLDLNSSNPFEKLFVIKESFSKFLIHPTKPLMAIRTTGGEIKIMNLSVPFQQQIPKTLSGRFKGRVDMKFSETGRRLVVKENNDALIYDLRSLDSSPLRLNASGFADVDSLRFVDSDRWLIGIQNREIWLRNLDARDTNQNKIVLKDQQILSISSHRGLLLSLSADRKLYLWNLNSNDFQSTPVQLTAPEFKREPVFAEISTNGNRIVVVQSPVNLKNCLVWEIEPEGANPTPRQFEIDYTKGAELSRDGNWFAYHQGSKFISLLNLDSTIKNAEATKIPIRKGGIYYLQISSDNRWLTADGPLALLFDLKASDIINSCVELPMDLKESETCRIAISEDSRWIAALTSLGKISFWNLLDDELIVAATKLLGATE